MSRNVSLAGSQRPAPLTRRPAFVLREPEDDWAPHAGGAPVSALTITVYAAHSPWCAHSEDLVDEAESAGLDVLVHDVRKDGAPTWLRGTPTLVDGDGAVYCGDAAFTEIQRLASLMLPHQHDLGSAQPHRPPPPMSAPSAAPSLTAIEAEAPSCGASLDEAFAESARMDALSDKFTPLGAVDNILETMMASRR
ncbi:hypothetical protein JKP88DRAFT_241303 [Tribonema minus]|uniref:Uncharacterized protein n=1 Tax=Tribonema minus TaxID=303371 RepID=A0A836CE34_9STRA|nr:hypothetical protein JKP88DRAFT_241303 [Tribonema minus]